MKALKHDPDRPAPEKRQIVLAKSGKIMAGDADLAGRRALEPASSISSDVLPLPEGPTMATTSAGSTRNETSLRICKGWPATSTV